MTGDVKGRTSSGGSLPFSDESGQEPLSLIGIAPGLAYMLFLSAVSVVGLKLPEWFGGLDWGVQLGLPLLTLLVIRRPPGALGYHRRRALAEYGWGSIGGGIWRGLSMSLNLWWLRKPSGLGGGPAGWLAGLVIVPLVEETFYRGYLGRALSRRLGPAAGVGLQAVLFTLHPTHWNQGWPGMFNIFLFAVLAGVLVEWRGTIWAAWGAHGFANILPAILAGLHRA